MKEHDNLQPTSNLPDNTPKVTGIGGIFFFSDNPEKTREWYAEMFLQYHFYPDNEYAKNFYKKAIKGGK